MQSVKLTESISTWFKETWDKIKFEEWFAKIGITSPDVVRIITFFIGAFAVGFLFKKYFKFALGCFILFVVVFVIFESKHIITFDWVAFKEFLGVDPANANVDSLFKVATQWIKNNVWVFASAGLGFLLGYKIG